MKSILTSLCRNTRGATAIEYGLICGLLVIGMLAALRGLGAESGGQWGQVSSKTIAAMDGVN